MSVVITVLLEGDFAADPELVWPLRVAAVHGGDVSLLFLASGEGEEIEQVDLAAGLQNDGPNDELAASLRTLLDRELTPDGWVASKHAQAAENESEATESDRRIRVEAQILPASRIASRARSIAAKPSDDLLITVSERLVRKVSIQREITRELLRDVKCEFVGIIPGRRDVDGEILCFPRREGSTHLAIPLALRLAKRYQRRAIALGVEPPIGPDSQKVGRQMLDRLLLSRLGDEAHDLGRHVEIQDAEADGILQACAGDRYEVFAMDIARPSDESFAETRLAGQVSRGTDEPTLIFTRGPMALPTRLQRSLNSYLRRQVPQLGREDRTRFVANVQSSSQWNFDFIALMGLSTAIATFGLIGNSAAVIIGAMLVAPLMTPLMGIGLSIVQSNMRLAAMTSRTALRGFLLAFTIGLAIGLLDTEFGIPTDEMQSRHWPGLVDVAVAFVAGLAAAYASGRPGLLAALPGVAIAASLVPPIASSGLALSLGDIDLAIGSMLLFFVNVIAIIAASAIVLWTVGFGGRSGKTPAARALAAGVALVALGTAIGISLAPPIAEPPLDLVEAVETIVGDRQRVRDVSLRREGGRPILQVDLGGTLRDHPIFGDDLVETARKFLGSEAEVRVTYRHEETLK